jgi:hypothetical protein
VQSCPLLDEVTPSLPSFIANCNRYLLEPRQRAISEELLAAIQLIQSSLRSGFELPPDRLQSEVLDAETEQEYKVCNWSGLVN